MFAEYSWVKQIGMKMLVTLANAGVHLSGL